MRLRGLSQASKLNYYYVYARCKHIRKDYSIWMYGASFRAGVLSDSWALLALRHRMKQKIREHGTSGHLEDSAETKILIM